MEQNQSQTQETIQETSLPKPQNNIEVVTAPPPKKKQRSEKQMQWSRELGRRSQEFKHKKYTMQNAPVTSPPNSPPASHQNLDKVPVIIVPT